MIALTPKEAAIIAKNVYQVHEGIRWDERLKIMGPDIGLGIEGIFSVTTSSRFEGTSGVHFVSAETGLGYIASGIGDRENEVLIAIRGTDNKFDWVTDITQTLTRGPSGYAVHAGFAKTFESFKPALHKCFDKCNLKPTVVHVVGHSLGGPLATLAADYLSQQSMHIKLYTFGSPRCGSTAYCQYLTKALGAENVYRVHHGSDPVSMLPIYPFCHVPVATAGYLLPWNSVPVSFSAHMMSNYLASVGDTSWLGLARSSPDVGWREETESWLKTAASDSGKVQMYSAKALWMIVKCIDWILDMVGRGVGLLVLAGVTILDRLAQLLFDGSLLALKISAHVSNLMMVIMRFLGRTAVKGVNLTVAFIKWVLDLLFRFASTAAQQALQLAISQAG